MNRHRKKTLEQAGEYQRYAKGWSGGYGDYRYGAVRVDGEYVDPKSRITLAGRHRQILNQDRRKHLVDRAVDLLRTVEFSRWQNEAPVRHGLRVGFILQGHKWHASDDAAADIVHRAFNLLGYGHERRPSADDVRDERYIPIENCLVCYRPLDDADIAAGNRFCCMDHAKYQYYRREYAEQRHNSEFALAARRLVYREQYGQGDCPQCTRTFWRSYEGQIHCSPKCKAASQVVVYDPRECALDGCTEVFTPTSRHPDQIYCCQAHATTSFATVQDRQCARDGCDHWFKPKHNNENEGGRRGLYCSRECADADRGSRVYSLICHCCGDPFTASMPNAQYCCEAHRQIVRKFERGQPPKRMSPAVFDYLFVAGRECEGQHDINQLFDAA